MEGFCVHQWPTQSGRVPWASVPSRPPVAVLDARKHGLLMEAKLNNQLSSKGKAVMKRVSMVPTYQKYHKGNQCQADNQHDDQPHQKQTVASISWISADVLDFLL